MTYMKASEIIKDIRGDIPSELICSEDLDKLEVNMKDMDTEVVVLEINLSDSRPSADVFIRTLRNKEFEIRGQPNYKPMQTIIGYDIDSDFTTPSVVYQGYSGFDKLNHYDKDINFIKNCTKFLLDKYKMDMDYNLITELVSDIDEGSWVNLVGVTPGREHSIRSVIEGKFRLPSPYETVGWSNGWWREINNNGISDKHALEYEYIAISKLYLFNGLDKVKVDALEHMLFNSTLDSYVFDLRILKVSMIKKEIDNVKIYLMATPKCI